jgi:hypothetical protein
VQSVSAYHLAKRIGPSDSIETTECDVFEGENLNYFFVGRPAYKVPGKDAVAAEWELPCCFIFEYEAIGDIKRIFPFDSGAHHLKLYPNYIQMMDMEEFEISSINDAPARIIGAYFGDARSYFDLTPKSQRDFNDEFGLGPLDAEVRAVHKLAYDSRGDDQYDDRRLTIEIQSEANVDLKITKPLAVILPAVYLDSPDIREAIETRWEAEAITYPIMPLSVKNYYGTIYEKVLNFYKVRGYL